MNIVLVGGGFAAASAAAALREAGHDGDVTLLAAEEHLPYERPPLSKAVLLGEATTASAVTHEASWYAEHDVDLRTGARVTALDLDRHHVIVDGEELAYDRLLLATGSVAKRLPQLDEAAAAHDLPILTLRTMEDADRLRGLLDTHPSGRLLVVGAGWIGLEVAAAARQAGVSVTVVDPADQPLAAVLGPRLGSVFADLHRDHGVELRLRATFAGLHKDSAGRVVVTLTDGHEVRPDLVVVGIGAAPAVDLAVEAGLRADNGVWVDARLRASDPSVFAAGDIAAHDHPVLGRRVRVEHWDTAAGQGRAAALVMLGGDKPYQRLPYFFTDQYDLGMEYVGHVPADAEVECLVRGDETARVLTAFWLSGRRVLAAAHLNDWDSIADLRALVGSDVSVDALRDPDLPLSALHEPLES